jgi:formylglycine-generating enzyme required for sulfatase activity
VDNVTGMAFVLVEGGCFRMGNPSPLAEPDETPAHEVCLSDFYMASCEVTQGDWEKVLGWVPSRFKGNRRNPVEGVSRIDAQSFIAAMNEKTGRNYRLPTEAEWEYAARGGAKGAGAEAVDLDRVAWYQDSADGETHPAGEMEPNALGIHDMLGNVWEWCSDGYDPSYYRRSPKKDPKGPATAKEHVVRGGAWSDPATHVRVTERGALYADDRSETNGFRLVFTP